MRSAGRDDWAAMGPRLRQASLPCLVVALGLLGNRCLMAGEAPPDWVHDALVVAMPAAAVGGCQAGIYTPSANGVRPWRAAMIRWLTGRQVMGNSAVLVRQEGPEGGAGLSAIVDPRADYVFQVKVILPGSGFGERPKEDVQIWAAVLGADDRVIAESPVPCVAGQWTDGQVAFSSGAAREVRCVVHARSPQRLPCCYHVEDFRLTRKDQYWWSPQNLFNAARTAVRLPDERGLLLRTLDPDVVGGHNGVYLNWDGFLTRRGIPVGGGQWEQEYNHVATDDPAAEQFLDNGVSRLLDGRPAIKTGLWPGYNMCHNAPAWHLYQQERLARIAPESDVLSQDNICSPSFWFRREKVCFCRWCCEGFRQWLRARWTAEQRRAADIADPAAFDVAQYVKDVQQTRIAKGREAVLADPVLRAFVQFQYASHVAGWRDTVAAVKRAAGHPVVVCGNQGGANGTLPHSVTLSQTSDVTAIETWGAMSTQNRAWDALACKLGSAAGEYRRPVWLFMTVLFSAPEAARSRLRLSGAQALADGGVPIPWATAAGSSGWFYDEEARRGRFAQQHRALMARRDRVANVGLVYSLPTHAWRKFVAFNLSSEPYSKWFGAWARLLEEAHVPYEANCWWHPLLGDDRVSLERLSRYRVLVLPGVDCFTDAQRTAVRAFQARGGRVINVSCQSYCDADAVPRPAGETLAADTRHSSPAPLPKGEGSSVIEVDPELVTRYARAGEKKPSPETAAQGAAAGKELQAIVRRALGDDQILQTDASDTVWANLWLDDTRQVLVLHLVNGDIDVAADRFRPVERSRWRVRLPAGLAVNRAVALSPDEPNEAKPLPVELSDGWATVVVPRLECYTVVALYAGEALKAADDVAAARRSLWRAGVIRGQSDTAARRRLDETLALLRAGRPEAGARGARELAADSAAELDRLMRREDSAHK